MKFTDYRQHVKTINSGKQLPTAIYLHQSAIAATLAPALMTLINHTIETLNITAQWNVIKLYKRDFKLTLLHYPGFDSTAYPPLHQSITIDLQEPSARVNNYDQTKNPPILHRKETFVLPDYPHIDTFIDITAQGEAIDLYKNTRTIGFRQQWLRLIKSKGYQLDDSGRLQQLGQIVKSEQPSQQPIVIQRHLTAIDRHKLSAPLQKLARHGFLDGQYSLLDYGCGKGDDVCELEAHGLDVNGWDPTHQPDGQLISSNIVNLGFVLNVIEDQQERQQTLLKAWGYATQLLMVSVMVVSDSKIEQFTPYKDGVITQRKTFQKYYAQAEIRTYLQRQLKTNAVAMGQGLFALFKDKKLEESFYLERQDNKTQWQQYTTKPSKLPKQSTAKHSLYDKHSELFNDFWQQCLILGRVPANDEFELSDRLRAVAGSHRKAFELLQPHFSTTDFTQAQQQRRNDVLVYFALSLFEKRQAKSHMPARLQRDIKAQFSNYNGCIEAAKELLFSVGKPQIIAQACELAHRTFNSGQLCQQAGGSHSYIFNKTQLNQMPPAIRAYVGCAAQLYGDLDGIDLIKVHIRSGKVTLLKYDNFTDKALPLLTERIKIRLHDLDIDFFIYGDEYPYQPLYDKSAFLDSALNPTTAEHKKQLAFEKRISKQLEGLPLEQLPNWDVLQRIFQYQGVELRGSRFYRI